MPDELKAAAETIKNYCKQRETDCENCPCINPETDGCTFDSIPEFWVTE